MNNEIRHVVVFDSKEPTEFLNLSALTAWEERHQTAVLISNTILGLKQTLRTFPHQVVLVPLTDKRSASEAMCWLAVHNIRFVMVPECWLPVEYFDKRTLDSVPPETVLSRSMNNGRFVRTHHVTDWGRLLDLLESLA